MYEPIDGPFGIAHSYLLVGKTIIHYIGLVISSGLLYIYIFIVFNVFSIT